jgi:two-component system, chemotaxis family, protein-glutamate methylesterase/glutaminase
VDGNPTTAGAAPPAIIAIGGSAGALEALVELLPLLPANLEAPVVIVLHQAADRDSELASALAAHCALRVCDADDKMALRGGCLYVAPPDYHLLLERGGTLALSSDEPVHFSRPSIDVLFESAALAFGDRAAGILLSGASADGAAGLALIKARGGRTCVQSPDTARVATMPREALALAPHDVLEPSQLGRVLTEWGYACD